MLLAAEGEVEVAHIQYKHTTQYGGQDEPRTFIIFPMILRGETKYAYGGGVVSVSLFLILNFNFPHESNVGISGIFFKHLKQLHEIVASTFLIPLTV